MTIVDGSLLQCQTNGSSGIAKKQHAVPTLGGYWSHHYPAPERVLLRHSSKGRFGECATQHRRVPTVRYGPRPT